MKPLDPRLLRNARAARGYVLLTAGLGVLTAALVVAQAILIASIAAPAITSARPLADAVHLLAALAVVVIARACCVGVQERFAHRAATRVTTDLRMQVVQRAVALGPRWAAAGRGPATVTLVTRGLDDLGPYFTRYLPQLLLAATLTPGILAIVGILDWVSALIVIVTIPLVPMFMILIGKLTQSVADKRLATMQRLGSQVLDLVAGIMTLRAFGRENGPAARVRALGDSHRRATMGTLRVAFLSGMVLELLTTLSVAIVAVGIGLRLVEGQLDLFTGLAVLIMAPEVYLPLRQVGLHFHASTDGIAAADAAFEILDTPVPPAAGTATLAADVPWGIRLSDVSVRAPARDVLAPANLSAVLHPGRITALAGPNGAGKSTTVLAVLGLITPDAGRVTLFAPDGREHDLSEVNPASWHSLITWVPQRAALPPGTLRELLGDGEPTSQRARAAQLTGFDEVVASLPDGWNTHVGQGGHGLSVGQRQRLALTRALMSDRPIVILDEPTAHLDSASQEQIHACLLDLRAQERTVLLIAHRDGLLALADDVVQIRSAAVTEVPAPGAATRSAEQTAAERAAKPAEQAAERAEEVSRVS